MGFYDRVILSRIIGWGMQVETLVPFRQKMARSARGKVLEIGIGPGLNLAHYGPEVSGLVGVDPSPELLAMAERRARDTAFPVSLIEGSGEELPVESGSVDTVVSTWTLCSIPNAAAALAEVRRVLRPDGAFLFIEHGHAPDPKVARWQDRLTPVWKRVFGGCHLNRPIDTLITGAGFKIAEIERGYHMPGPKPIGYLFEGRAAPLS